MADLDGSGHRPALASATLAGGAATLALAFRCSGCGVELPAETRTPFTCPNRASVGSVDHIIERSLPLAAEPVDSAASHPFIRYRGRLSSYAAARLAGWSDARFSALVHDLDAAVARVDGRGFRRSPLQAVASAPETRSGSVAASARDTVLAKLELHGVAGSHKARHLFGLMLWLRVQELAGHLEGRPPLAIASCGNAALAAAVVARAASWPISVFVPTDASAVVLERLRSLAADVVECGRVAGVAGDPTVARFRAAVAAGALPFCCQGTDNGLTIEGGETLGWELAEDLAAAGGADTLWVQVGGGALATGCWRGLKDAQAAGVIAATPRLITVQTGGAWPLGRAWLRFVAELLDQPEIAGLELDPAHAGHAPQARICGLAAAAGRSWRADRARHHARLAQRWHSYMAPWPTAPASVAHGILDDETYDGRALVAAMLDSEGWPIVATEAHLAAAGRDLRDGAGQPVPVTPTGAAGLAGVRQHLADRGSDGASIALGPRHIVLLTGLDRDAAR